MKHIPQLLILVFIISSSFTSCAQTDEKTENKTLMETNKKENLKQSLTPIQYHVTQENGTERPFTGKYWDHFKKGAYHCVVCDTYLFESEYKFESGCGWPSFSDAEKKENLTLKKDLSHGMARTEVRCANCDAHLGHVFNDGPKPTGLRYCINSASIKFKKE